MNDIKTIRVDSIPEKPRYLKALVKSRYTRYINSMGMIISIAQIIISNIVISAKYNILYSLI